MTKYVGLHYLGYFEPEFIEQCRAELQKTPLLAAMGQPPTALQKLAYDVLKGCGQLPAPSSECVSRETT